MLRELDLTEEELLIINKNEKNAKINIFQNEQKFKILLNEYLKTHKKKPCEAANVPNDGSCLYHAILHSFAAKYNQQIEINHQKMREKVAIHMLRGQENTEYLRNFAMNENNDNSNSGITIGISSSSKKAVQERYVKYAENHMYNTLDWPIELCLHIVAELYNLDLTVLQEAMDPREGRPSGYICERLRTVGLLLMTSSSSTAVTEEPPATPSSSTSTSSNTSTQPVLTSPQSNSKETRAIIIGNRWDQHYYSIGILTII